MPQINTQTITSEAREIILNIINAVELEAQNNHLQIPLSARTKRAAYYAGVSISSIKRIRKENNKLHNNPNKALRTPGKKYKKQKGIKDKYGEVDFQKIRETIEEFYYDKKIPTVKELLESVKQKMEFTHSRTSFYRLLKSKGYIWKKLGGKGTKVLMERPDIVNERYKFISALQKYRLDKSPIVYMDKTCVSVDNNPSLVLLHAGSPEIGFLKSAGFVLNMENSGQTLVSQDTLEKWVCEHLLPNLLQGSVIVMYDSPSFFSNQETNVPNKYSTKQYIESWFESNDIPFDPTKRKPELLTLLNSHLANHKPSPKNIIGDLLTSQGHSVLSLPSFLSELNPIELAWTDLKAYIDQNSSIRPSSSEVMVEIIFKALESISLDKWKEYGRHTQDLENRFWINDEKLEIVLDELISNLGDGDKAKIAYSESSVSDEDDPDDFYDEEEDL